MKDKTLSMIRMISMFMIIACHILQGIGNPLAFYINSGVFVFFFLSGYLYGKKEIKNITKWYQKRFLKIMLPLIILILVIVCVEGYFHRPIAKQVIFANMIGFGGFYGLIPVLSHTWFISCILICYFITPILQCMDIAKKENSEKQFWGYLFSIMLLLILFQKYAFLNMHASQLSTYIVGYFVAKRYVSRKNEFTKQGNRFFNIVLILTVVTFPLRIFMEYHKEYFRFIILPFEAWYFWFQALLGISVFILLYRFFHKYPNLINEKLCKWSDLYSYDIYLVHQIFILGSYSLLGQTKFLWFNIILIVLLSFFGGVILHYVTMGIEKILMWLKCWITNTMGSKIKNGI